MAKREAVLTASFMAVFAGGKSLSDIAVLCGMRQRQPMPGFGQLAHALILSAKASSHGCALLLERALGLFVKAAAAGKPVLIHYGSVIQDAGERVGS